MRTRSLMGRESSTGSSPSQRAVRTRLNYVPSAWGAASPGRLVVCAESTHALPGEGPLARRRECGIIAYRSKRSQVMKPKNTICLWFNKDAQDAARFYAETFPNSEVTAVHKAPGDFPSG